MREETKNKVYGAVRSCLNRCYGAPDPLVQASKFLSELRHDPSWADREVSEVESMVLGAVRVIVRQPRAGCCQEETRGKQGSQW